MVADPILLIEFLFPSNEVETWANIWAYTTIPSVVEILIASGTKVEAEVLRRRDDGSWPETPERGGPGDQLRLECIDFVMALQSFYRTTALAVRPAV